MQNAALAVAVYVETDAEGRRHVRRPVAIATRWYRFHDERRGLAVFVLGPPKVQKCHPSRTNDTSVSAKPL